MPWNAFRLCSTFRNAYRTRERSEGASHPQEATITPAVHPRGQLQDGRVRRRLHGVAHREAVGVREGQRGPRLVFRAFQADLGVSRVLGHLRKALWLVLWCV